MMGRDCSCSDAKMISEKLENLVRIGQLKQEAPREDDALPGDERR